MMSCHKHSHFLTFPVLQAQAAFDNSPKPNRRPAEYYTLSRTLSRTRFNSIMVRDKVCDKVLVPIHCGTLLISFH